MLSLKEEQLAAQVAVRKRDDAKIDLYIKSCKKMSTEMTKLLCTVRCIARGFVPGPDSVSISDADELGGVIVDVIGVTVSVSAALFNGISLSFGSRKSSWIGLRQSKKMKRVKAEEGIEEFQQVGVENLWGLRKKGDEEVKMVLKRMQDLEGCICDIESGGERVFRGLINTRVSLLNSLTQ